MNKSRNKYVSSDVRFQLPYEEAIPPFIAYRTWNKEIYIVKMELHKVKKQKGVYYSERKAFARWLREDTNFHEYKLWRKVMDHGDAEMAKSLAKSVLNEFELFCVEYDARMYFRHAENFYRRLLNLAHYHFNQGSPP